MGSKNKRKKVLKQRGYQKKVLGNKIEATKRALLSKIIKWDDPVLKTPAKEVDNLKGNQAVARDIIEVLEATEDGVGMAANQIGSLHRVFVTRPEFPEKKKAKVFINPKISYYSDEKETAKEGCLSYPEHYCEIERSAEVIVDYTDIDGKKQTDKFDGWHARIIQHEYDHLDGKCLVGDDYFASKKKDQKQLATS